MMDIIFLYIGEDQNGSSITKLFYMISKYYESDFEFVGLRESTAEFVDYDSDGDLDIFITGMGEDEQNNFIWVNEILKLIMHHRLA